MMNRNKLSLTTSLFLAIIAAAGCATKADIDRAIAKATHPLHIESALRAKLLPSRALDGDRDNKITNTELARWAEQSFAYELARADADGDSKLAAKELAYARTNAPGARLRASMDSNRDGALTLAEHSQFVSTMVDASLKKLDSDGDNAVSAQEFVHVVMGRVAAADRDKNGVLERSELAAGTSAQPRAYQQDRQLHIMICGPICVWELPDGIYDNNGSDGGGDSDEDPYHPGCTSGDVNSGNCICPWPDYCGRFFD